MTLPLSGSADERFERSAQPVHDAELGHVWFLESLDAVHRAIQGSSDLTEELQAALAVLLDVFAADRAWLLEAHGETWTPVGERTRPEYPGGLELGVKLPLTAETARRHRRTLESDWAVQLNVEEVASIALPEGVAAPKAILAMAIYPKVGKPGLLGLHQCAYQRTWSPAEERLFVEIGHRLADALTILLAYRDVRVSEQKLAQAQRVARLGYWEHNVETFEVNYSEETCRIFGLPREVHTLQTVQLAERLHPDDRHIMVEAYERAIAGGPRYDVDYRVLRPDGDVRYVHSEADVTCDSEGRPLRMFGTMQDITEHKRTENRLVRYQVALQEVVREQEALRRVATLVARAAAPDLVFAAVAEEAGKLLSADIALIGRYGPGPTVTGVVGWHRDGQDVPLGKDVRLGGQNTMSLVYSTGGPVRLEAYSGATGEVATWGRAIGIGSAIGVPIEVEDRLWGVMMVSLRQEERWPPGTEERLANFTELAATAIANAEGRAQLVAARRRVIEAADAARARLARDIHDGAQQRFLTGLLDLQLAQQKRPLNPVRAWELVDVAAEEVEAGVQTLRELAAGVHPGILSDMGLGAALRALAGRMPVPLSVEVDELELSAALEASVYFFCSEGLANVVKHARASAAWVRVEAVDGELRAAVRDDGVGGADIGVGGTGLVGLHDRVGALEGSLTVSSPRGVGTTLTARIPLPG
ncbi:MAG: PAS domain-containing protein [Solirubrobacterales bacterium]|nr:PAS domain-containing protein [Solirubrobacterales bacterium]